MSRLAHQFAVESENVRGEIVELTEFPELAREYGVTSVPKTVVDGHIELQGVTTASALLDAMGLVGEPPVGV